jgi:DUF1707 SHOCT-like domain
MTDEGLRISDDDRERAARALREHFAAGRLTGDELEKRLETIYSAQTLGSLRSVLADMPALPATRAQQRAELATRRGPLTRHLLQQTGGALAPFLVCTLVWAFSSPHGSFWPAWVALVALVPLLRNLWRLYGPAPELERVEAELAEQSRRDQHRR